MLDAEQAGTTLSSDDSDRNLGIYCALLLSGVLATLFMALGAAAARVRSADIMHARILSSVMAAPVSFFDVTPTGRILNRFSKDTTVVDQILIMLCMWAAVLASSLIASLSAVAVATRGTFLVLLLPIVFVYLLILRYIRPTSVSIKRLESVTRSPIFASFSETLNGLRCASPPHARTHAR